VRSIFQSRNRAIGSGKQARGVGCSGGTFSSARTSALTHMLPRRWNSETRGSLQATAGEGRGQGPSCASAGAGDACTGAAQHRSTTRATTHSRPSLQELLERADDLLPAVPYHGVHEDRGEDQVSGPGLGANAGVPRESDGRRSRRSSRQQQAAAGNARQLTLPLTHWSDNLVVKDPYLIPNPKHRLPARRVRAAPPLGAPAGGTDSARSRRSHSPSC
jgi:hypothetical protein